MRRWLRWAISTILVLSACLWLGSKLERIARRVAASHGAAGDFREVTGKQLDRDVRSNLPPGTPRAAAEEFLRRKGIRFSFEPEAQALVANASYIKGNPMGYSSLRFIIHLDERSRVTSVDSKVKYAGP